MLIINLVLILVHPLMNENYVYNIFRAMYLPGKMFTSYFSK